MSLQASAGVRVATLATHKAPRGCGVVVGHARIAEKADASHAIDHQSGVSLTRLRNLQLSLAIVAVGATSCGRLAFDNETPRCAEWGSFSPPSPMANVPKGAVRPSLQLDGTAMYMTHDGYIARAVRGPNDAAFAPPSRVPEFVGLVFAGVALADSGLRLYLHGDANNGEDRLAVASRPTLSSAWQTPVLLEVGTEPHSEIYPAISADELRLYWANHEGELKVEWASRTSLTAPFVAQPAIPGLNVGQVWMPTESHSGLELFFTRNDDVWRMARASLADPWGAPARVDELSSNAIDYVGTFSADDSTMYFNYQNSAQPAEFTLWQSKRWCVRL